MFFNIYKFKKTIQEGIYSARQNLKRLLIKEIIKCTTQKFY